MTAPARTPPPRMSAQQYLEWMGLAPPPVPERAPRRKRAAPEEALHRAVAEWLDRVSGSGETFAWWHTHNSVRLSKREAGTAKALGRRAGLPDLFLFSDGRLFAIELKSAGGRLSSAQVGVHARLLAEGCRVAVARSLEEVDHLVADAWRLPMRCRPTLFPALVGLAGRR